MTRVDGKPRSMWERLGAKGAGETNFIKHKGRLSTRSSKTTGCAKPDAVVAWKFRVKTTLDKLSTEQLKLPYKEAFSVYSHGESTMRSNFFSPVTTIVESCCNELRKDASNDNEEVVSESEQYLLSGLRADAALLVEGIGTFIFIEAKSPGAYPRKKDSGKVHDPVDMAEW